MIWQIDQHRARVDALALPDVAPFLAALNAHADFFDAHSLVTVARAPGRLDLMGGIADYSGAMVLQWPLAVATFVAVQPSSDALITIRSPSATTLDAVPEVVLPIGLFQRADGPLSYAAAHKQLTADQQRRWAAYVAGVLVVLQHEANLTLQTGLRILIHSNVPVGKGVSSSASLEVATMQALSGALNIDLDGRTLALLCQTAENRVVGAPCGVMDQMATACGMQQQLMALLCQPAELMPAVRVPTNVAVWGIDSGVRHEVSGSDYGDVRTGAFMGYRILADAVGLPARVHAPGNVTIDDDRWHGYLANITPGEWEHELSNAVPDYIEGATFLERYGGITDSVTRVDPARTYAVRQPTAHPIYEHVRVQRFRELLQYDIVNDVQFRALGELMYQSHASYTACGLGSSGTDLLVELASAAGPAAGVYGAKITGGGSGGTVAVIARPDANEAVYSIAAQYQAETGRNAVVLGGSSPGAVHFGLLQLRGSGP